MQNEVHACSTVGDFPERKEAWRNHVFHLETNLTSIFNSSHQLEAQRNMQPATNELREVNTFSFM